VNELRVIPQAPAAGSIRLSSAPKFTYVQFLIDGEDLRALVGGSHLVQEVGPPPEIALLPSRHLMGAPDEELIADGLPFLLVCQIDADPYCGGITAGVEVGADVVTWRGFARVSFDFVAGAWERQELEVGPFVFRARDYESALGST